MQEQLVERLNRSFVSRDFTVVLNLPPGQNVKGAESRAHWVDNDGTSYGQNETEEEVIKEWLTDFLSKKIGYPIHIIAVLHGSNGENFAFFKRAPTKVVQFRRS